MLTYMGPQYQHRRPDSPNDFIRGQALEVSQAWLDEHRKHFTKSGQDFLIVGDEGVHSDEDNDGVPDKSWNRKKVLGWLAGYDIVPNGYATKTTLLDLVGKVMNPEQVAEVQDLVSETQAEEEKQEMN